MSEPRVKPLLMKSTENEKEIIDISALVNTFTHAVIPTENKLTIITFKEAGCETSTVDFNPKEGQVPVPIIFDAGSPDLPLEKVFEKMSNSKLLKLEKMLPNIADFIKLRVELAMDTLKNVKTEKDLEEALMEIEGLNYHNTIDIHNIKCMVDPNMITNLIGLVNEVKELENAITKKINEARESQS